MKINKIICLLVFAVGVTAASAKEVKIKVYDHKLRKKIPITVNTVTGYYKIPVVELFMPEYFSNSSDSICDMTERYLNTNPEAMADSLRSSDNGVINWTLFTNFRKLDYLQDKIKNQLRKDGYKVDKLTNVTKATVTDIMVDKVTWESDALSLVNTELMVRADYELKQMLKFNFGKAHKNGTFTSKPKYDFLYCDLLNKKLKISFKVKGYQHDYYDDDIAPMSGSITKSEITNLSDQLYSKTNLVRSLSQGYKTKISQAKAKHIVSSAFLGQLLVKRNISLEDLNQGQFIDLVDGLIDLEFGLPKKITDNDAFKIEKKLLRTDFSSEEEISFGLSGIFK